MKKYHLYLTVYITWIAIAVTVAVAVGLSWILDVNDTVRALLPKERTAILVGFYCCLPLILLTLWKVLRLLLNIRKKAVFVQANVKLLSTIRNCCIGIFAVCLIAGFFFFPLFFVASILGFLGLLMQVLKQVFAQAVIMREENDLTV